MHVRSRAAITSVSSLRRIRRGGTSLVALAAALAAGCGAKGGDAKATRDDCARVAEHIADLVVAEAVASPAALHAAAIQSPDGGGGPSSVTAETFAAWLRSPEGATWLMQRRGQTLSSTQQGIDSCTSHATAADVRCLLAATSRAQVGACDDAAQRRRGGTAGRDPAAALDGAGASTEASPGAGSSTGADGARVSTGSAGAR